MKERPWWCRAATPEECDHPYGCSACKAVPAPLTEAEYKEVIDIYKRLLPDPCPVCGARWSCAHESEPHQSVGAVARPASRNARLSIRDEKSTDQRGSSRDRSRE